MSEQEFNAAITIAANFFSLKSKAFGAQEASLPKASLSNKEVLIVTHIDCDGLAAAAILAKLCETRKIEYNIKRIRELNDQVYEELKQVPQEVILFVDIGSSQTLKINDHLNKKAVLILDHHHLQETNAALVIKELNPKLHGLKERRIISSSGIAYLFASKLMDATQLLPLALVGAIGDAQEEDGFIGYNKQFLEEAIKEKLIQEKRTLRLFGRQTRPVLKALQYSVDIPMKGITNDRDGALDLLRELHIPANRFGKRMTLDTLTKEEEEMLNEELLARMSDEVKQRAWWNEYTLLNRPKGSQTRNLREFSTLLNACGRLDDIELGVRICLGDKGAEREANERRNDYRQTINQSKQWIQEHPEQVIIEGNVVIIIGEDNIPADIAGTIASIYSKSGYYDKETIVCVISNTDNNEIKISTRTQSKEVDLVTTVDKIINEIGGSSGGHKNAAGATTTKENQEEFINKLKEELKQ